MSKNVRVALSHTCLLGEGPVWDVANKRILWLDILEGEIHEFIPKQNKHLIFETAQLIGAMAVRNSGGLVAAMENGFATIDMERGEIRMIANPEASKKGNRFNDGKCDPAGRFWAGTMAMSGQSGAGALYTLEKDFSISVKLKEVSCSNGLAWSGDQKTMYFIDTPTRKVAAYRYDIKDGNIKDKKVIIHFSEEEGYPDGMTIDTEGMLWIAFFDGWKVARWNPMTGELLFTISLPVSKVTSCTFGGETFEDLYVTSARTGLSEEELQSQPLAGSLFVIKKCGFQGMEAYEFQG